MEIQIPAWLFFSFWALISITFLHLGFYTLDKTELSHSVSPVIISFFKHSLAISSCCSSSYALIFRPQSTKDLHSLYLWVGWGVFAVLYIRFVARGALSFFNFIAFDGILWGVPLYVLINFFAWLLDFRKLKAFANRYSLTTTIFFLPTALFDSFPWCIPISTLINLAIVRGDQLIPELKIHIVFHMAVEASIFFVSAENTKFFPVLVVFVSCFISAFVAALSGFGLPTLFSGSPWLEEESLNELLLPVAEKVKEIFLMLKGKKMGELIGFAVGMVGTVLFQEFFKLTSFNHVVAFLYLAVMWVANLTLLGVSGDFGVLNFLLGNVVVGCTVNQFGLRSTTWLACGASVLLFGLRLKLKSLNLVYGEGEKIQVTLL